LIARVAGVREFSTPLLERARGVRRGYLVAGAAGVVSLIVAVALVAAGGGEGGGTGWGTRAEEATVTESSGGASTTSVDESIRDDSLSATVEAAETSLSALEGLEPESLLNPSPEEWPAVTDELIDRWLECHAALTSPDARPAEDCASEIVHAGSAAAALIGDDDPRHEVLRRWHEQGGESVVMERMGGAALIDLLVPISADRADSVTPAPTTAASLLVVRSEAGWRVRDVLVDDPVD
jgi:hypothetical protein